MTIIAGIAIAAFIGAMFGWSFRVWIVEGRQMRRFDAADNGRVYGSLLPTEVFRGFTDDTVQRDTGGVEVWADWADDWDFNKPTVNA